MTINVREATSADGALLAALHSCCFDEAWDAGAFRALLARPGSFALVASESETELQGFILIQLAGPESEIQSLCTHPLARRKGLGGTLVRAAAAACFRCEAQELFLEVAEDNHAALALYLGAGFTKAGLRKHYYPRARGMAADAVILSATLPLTQS